MTEQVGKLAAKMVAAMKEIGVVEKRGKNTKQDYKFVKATDVANEVRAALIAAGVATIFDVESERFWDKPTANGGLMFFCSLSVRGTFIDSETGETLSGRAIGWGSDSLDKAPYKAMTGALKYILRMNFLIPDEDDPENDNNHYTKGNQVLQNKPSTQPLTPIPITPATAPSTPVTSGDFWYENGVMDCEVMDVRHFPAKNGKKETCVLLVNSPEPLPNKLTCWHVSLVPALASAKKGDRAVLVVKEANKDGKKYLNIEDVRAIGAQLFHEGLPVIQQSDEITDSDIPF